MHGSADASASVCYGVSRVQRAISCSPASRMHLSCHTAATRSCLDCMTDGRWHPRASIQCRLALPRGCRPLQRRDSRWYVQDPAASKAATWPTQLVYIHKPICAVQLSRCRGHGSPAARNKRQKGAAAHSLLSASRSAALRHVQQLGYTQTCVHGTVLDGE